MLRSQSIALAITFAGPGLRARRTVSRVTRCAVAALVVSSLVVAGGCSSKNKSTKAAAGAAKPTTKQPPRPSTPAKKAGASVSGNKSAAAPVASDQQCTAAEDGLAACVDNFAVFCSATKLYAIDCEEAFGGTCGEVGGAIDCVVEVEE